MSCNHASTPETLTDAPDFRYADDDSEVIGTAFQSVLQGKVIIKDSLGYVQSIGHYVNGNMYFISTDKDTDYYIRNKSCFILEIFKSIIIYLINTLH